MTQTLHWKHLDFSDPEDAHWIRHESGLADIVSGALLDADSRPRMLTIEAGILVILRGVNQNPDSDMEDMISIRVWIDQNRIISTSRRKLVSVDTLQKAVIEGRGPMNAGEFLSTLTEYLGDFINLAIERIEDSLDSAEEDINNSTVITRNSPFTTLRRKTARIRRYLAPQKEALDRLSRSTDPFFSANDKMCFSEQANRLTLFLESLDLIRERAMVAQEEYLGIVAHEQNARMLVLSIVAAVFLPLAFLTGLMGMNVAGLPGMENPWAFWILVGLMLLSAGMILALFRIKNWL
jgi:zinc transporter